MVAVWLIIVLAIVQGLLEWLPVSSEGQLVLILNWVGETENALAIALFMHIGTLIAVCVKFWPEIFTLFGIKNKKNMKKEITQEDKEGEVIKTEENEESEDRKTEQKFLWKFLLIATAATGVIGVPLYLIVKYLLNEGDSLLIANGALQGGDLITMIIGVFLISTGIFILISKKKTAKKSLFEMKNWEIIVVGAIQGLAVIPGVSRSGSTVGTMLIEGIEEEDALRGSFLLSIPAVIGANILTLVIDLIQGDMSFTGIPIYAMFLAIIISGVVGYLTIDLFLRLARKINFGWFCIAFGALALVITIITIILQATTV